MQEGNELGKAEGMAGCRPRRATTIPKPTRKMETADASGGKTLAEEEDKDIVKHQ
jgi:hypothetical protein